MANVAGSRRKSLREKLAEQAAMLLDPRPAISDAWWALNNPLERIKGEGRAADSQMAFPLGGRYAPRTKGLTAETLEKGDPFVNFEGLPEVVSGRKPIGENYYNLRNALGEIVASGNRSRVQNTYGNLKRGDVAVPEVWVREDYRKTPAFFDLMNLITRGGKEADKLHGSFANRRLEKVFQKRMSKQRQSVPKPKNPELTPPRKPDNSLAIALAQEQRRRPSQFDDLNEGFADLARFRLEQEAMRRRLLPQRRSGR